MITIIVLRQMTGFDVLTTRDQGTAMNMANTAASNGATVWVYDANGIVVYRVN